MRSQSSFDCLSNDLSKTYFLRKDKKAIKLLRYFLFLKGTLDWEFKTTLRKKEGARECLLDQGWRRCNQQHAIVGSVICITHLGFKDI